MPEPQPSARSRTPLILANSTACLASVCVMVIELTAGRIVARYLGTSVYTWTAVIGVVLSGIALGNYLGGRLADQDHPSRVLSRLFVIASLACGLIPVLNRIVGSWDLLWLMRWPVRVVGHIACVFLAPAIFLGMVGSIVAKVALDQGRPPGWTVGTVYAWSAIGGIAGTFLTGFVLLERLGTTAIFWGVGTVLAALAIACRAASWRPYGGSALLVVLIVLSAGPNGSTQIIGERLGLREPRDPTLLYEHESPYFYIRVVESRRVPSVRWMMLDQVLHSAIDLRDPATIDQSFQYPYMTVWSAVTRQAVGSNADLRALMIGGGGYVFPRYLRRAWPTSTIDTVEIDPAITAAAMRVMAFAPDEHISIHHLDARSYINDLALRRRRDPAAVPAFDVIYGDALSGLSVPFQLATRECNEEIRSLLAPAGVYMVTVIDMARSGRFIGAMAQTFQQSFPFVYVIAAGQVRDSEFSRNMFVVIGANQALDLAGLNLRASEGSVLGAATVKQLEERAEGLVLRDDHAPVDNLIAQAASQDGRQRAAAQLTWIGDRLDQRGRLDAAIRQYRLALTVDPEFAGAHNNLGSALARQGSVQEARDHFQEAVRLASDFAEPHSNLAAILAAEGDVRGASEELQRALAIVPRYAEVHYNLGVLLAQQGRVSEALEQYYQAAALNPEFAEARVGLANVLATQQRLEDAVEQYGQALEGSLSAADRAQVYHNLGAIYESVGRFDEAAAQYRQALEHDPTYERARQGLERVQPR